VASVGVHIDGVCVVVGVVVVGGFLVLLSVIALPFLVLTCGVCVVYGVMFVVSYGVFGVGVYSVVAGISGVGSVGVVVALFGIHGSGHLNSTTRKALTLEDEPLHSKNNRVNRQL